ncbi:MAG: hypothetical protein AAGF26_01600 [Cyanobacteria bacterium P01_G01_bin.49]
MPKVDSRWLDFMNCLLKVLMSVNHYWKVLATIDWRMNMGVMQGYIKDDDEIRSIIGDGDTGTLSVTAPPLAGENQSQIAWQTEEEIISFRILSIK